MAKWIQGIDASFSRIDREAFHEFYTRNYRVYIQNLWTGGFARNPAIKAVAEANLRDAKAEGLAIAGYINSNPWRPAAISLDNARINAGSMWDGLTVVAVGIEIAGTKLPELREHLDAVDITGVKTCIYTGKWYWEIIGNPKDSWLKAYRLWNALYDDDPDIDFPHAPYGPWRFADVCAEQYQGDLLVAPGVVIDKDTLDADFWLPQRPTPTPAPAPGHDDMALPSHEIGIYKIVNLPQRYQWDGFMLYHIANPEVLNGMGLSWDVTELSPNDPLWQRPVVFPGGLLGELR